VFYNRAGLCSAILTRQTDESFIGGIGLVAAENEMPVDEPPQAELYTDAYQPFGPCLSDLAFDCLGSRMRSISSNCVARQFVGDGLLLFLPKPDQLDILHPSPPRVSNWARLMAKVVLLWVEIRLSTIGRRGGKGHVELTGNLLQAWIV
jgi:hypothetical protein